MNASRWCDCPDHARDDRPATNRGTVRNVHYKTVQRKAAPAENLEPWWGSCQARCMPALATPLHAAPTPEPSDRRVSGRRARARDRLMDRATQPYSPNTALRGVNNIGNLMLFVDDDLRETALAITRIEGYLTRTLSALESPSLCRKDVQTLAADVDVLDHLDHLNETLESLRRRLAKLAGEMRR